MSVDLNASLNCTGLMIVHIQHSTARHSFEQDQAWRKCPPGAQYDICTNMATGLPCFKVILYGEYGAGKSSIFRRFVDNSFTPDTGPKSTIGLDHFKKEFNVRGRTIMLELWDTAGMERFATMSASYFQGTTAAILCYASNDRDSFNMLSQHILDIIMHSNTAKIFLCGNKTDKEQDAGMDMITASDISDFQDQCDAVLSGSFKVSCKTGEGIKEMFTAVAQEVQRDAYQKFDPSRVRVHQAVAPKDADRQKCCGS